MSVEYNCTEYGWAWYQELLYNMWYLEFFGLWNYGRAEPRKEVEPKLPRWDGPICRGHGPLATYADHEEMCAKG